MLAKNRLRHGHSTRGFLTLPPRDERSLSVHQRVGIETEGDLECPPFPPRARNSCGRKAVSQRHVLLFLYSFHVVDAGTDQGWTGLLVRFFFRRRQSGGASRPKLDKILRKEQIESPIQSHEDFLFKSGQFHQVDRPPQPPGNEA